MEQELVVLRNATDTVERVTLSDATRGVRTAVPTRVDRTRKTTVPSVALVVDVADMKSALPRLEVSETTLPTTALFELSRRVMRMDEAEVPSARTDDGEAVAVDLLAAVMARPSEPTDSGAGTVGSGPHAASTRLSSPERA